MPGVACGGRRSFDVAHGARTLRPEHFEHFELESLMGGSRAHGTLHLVGCNTTTSCRRWSTPGLGSGSGVAVGLGLGLGAGGGQGARSGFGINLIPIRRCL
jgi:hypothetical protein